MTTVPNASAFQRVPLHPRDVGILSALILCFRPANSTYAQAPSVETSVMIHVLRVCALEVSGVRCLLLHRILAYLRVAFRAFIIQGYVQQVLSMSQAARRQARADVDTLIDPGGDVCTQTSLDTLDSYHIGKVGKSVTRLQDRRSLFGITVRRARINWVKLSFQGQVEFVKLYQAWLRGEWVGRNLPRSEPATESLRRFFDQPLTDNDDTGLHQHALLNLEGAFFIYSYGLSHQYPLQALEEAIKVSRAANDRDTLQRCMAIGMNRLLRRIAPSAESPQVIQKGTDPIDILWDIKRSMDMGEPIQVGFSKLFECIGCESALPTTATVDYCARFSVQSALWKIAGVDSLAQTHFNLIMTFTTPGHGSEPRLTAQLAKARALSRQGKSQEAVVGLLDPDVWRGLNRVQKETWAREIWCILEGQARRRGQERLTREFFQPRKPADALQTQVLREDHMFLRRLDPMSQLQNAIDVIHSQQIPLSLQPLLDALWTTEFRGTWPLYRTGIALLADLGVGLGMARSGREFLEQCMAQVYPPGTRYDLEQRAFACFTLAKCIMTAAKGDDPIPPARIQEHLKLALFWLHIAEKDYASIEFYTGRLDVLYTLSVVYHNLGMIPERDRTASLHAEVEKKRVEMVRKDADEELRDVWEIVCEIAARD
ncbi:Apc5 domain-containing protein [Rhizoctonia solani AG-1 IA]|uniref:Anaphase-promoting complex subunit 5 n=1 Tax=Thanatephorus cucumeris (strain AG1-IA) TaxID=983506 RepID=L8X3K8_THACA|nr:Apc5 domain-containing protein [Rhizoctonia solani AG-1 IA]